MKRPITLVPTIPDREQAICARLRELRLLNRWSQEEFAGQLGISRERLASYEYSRAQVRFMVAYAACSVARVTPWWLAEGAQPMHWPVFIAAAIREQIPPRMLFSDAYDRFLKPHLETERLEALRMTEGCTDSEADEIRDVFPISIQCHNFDDVASILLPMLKRWLKDLPPQFYSEYSEGLASMTRAFVEQKKLGLTGISLKRKSTAMQSELSRLLARVKKLTKAPGSKVKLAELLGVAPARITEWLSERHPKEPGGETTLKLLKWVEERERNANQMPTPR